jgi:amino acid transporter
MSILDVLLGKPLATSEERAERVGPIAGIPIFGLDALSSAAYGPEAALTLLIPLGLLGSAYIVPITTAIIILLIIVFFSYRQTIEAYPGGGGSYTVAKENLGDFPGLLAAAALMIDYVLTAAVGISAGVGALVSAVPSMQPHILPICLGILLVVTIVNLRGVREAGGVFMIPTYLFLGTLLTVIGVGIVKVIAAGGGDPTPVVHPPAPAAAIEAVSVWLLLKVFASGCTALTGVEAVSNGVKAFREPTDENARKTLTMIIVLLIALLAGIAYLVKAYHITGTDPTGSHYESTLSILIGAVLGKGVFYYVTIGSILLVLCLSANTAFADFPRLCKIISQDDYLPHSFASRGRRLVFSQGIYMLAGLTALLLIVFRGVTDRLIPLYAVGAFLAFTLSQAGMVIHWKKAGGKHFGNMFVNGLGAFMTGITVLVIMVAKFTEGAWITMMLIPTLLFLMEFIRKQYRVARAEVKSDTPLELDELKPPIVVIPIERWSLISKQALRFALMLSPDVLALHVTRDEDDSDDHLAQQWQALAQDPAAAMKLPPPKLELIHSPYRYVITPILDYVLALEKKEQGRNIAVLIPEMVEKHWYQYLLHNQRAAMLKGTLYLKGSHRIIVVNVPWYQRAS